MQNAIDAIHEKQARCEKYDAYYEGDHPLAFVSPKFKNEFSHILRQFSDNLCKPVVDSVVDQLEITGFGIEDDGIRESAKEIWDYNQMDEQAGQIHQEAIKQGESFAIVWDGDEGIPEIHPNEARLMHLQYDSENPKRKEWAVKAWMEGDKAYMTVYYPDRIEKYQAKRSSYGAFPVKWNAFIEREQSIDNPYNEVPVFHFRNNPGINRRIHSELKGAIPLQDMLNKSVIDLAVAMEFAALPQRYATGLDVEYDESGTVIPPFTPGVDRIWASPSKDVDFGQFDPADLQQFLAVQESFRNEMCRVTGTPFSYLMLVKEPPSGESLKVLERRFNRKIRDRHTGFGNTWIDVIRFGLLIRGHVLSTSAIKCIWLDTTYISLIELIRTTLSRQSAGISKQRTWREDFNMSDKEIEDNLKELMKESAFRDGIGELLNEAFERSTQSDV